MAACILSAAECSLLSAAKPSRPLAAETAASDGFDGMRGGSSDLTRGGAPGGSPLPPAPSSLMDNRSTTPREPRPENKTLLSINQR